MISSRTHAGLDAGLVAVLAGVALAPVASPRVRWAAAVAAVIQAGNSALTDYEGGVTPWLGMREHRRIDLAAAAGLGVAGALFRSPVLLGAAALDVGLALARETEPHGHAPEMLYRPLDTPKRLARDVWIVDSAIGPGIPVRMTVIRLASGGLLLHSPTRFSAGLRRTLEEIGPIEHLVAPNSVHWMFVKAWQDAVPAAMSYGAPGLRRRRQVRRAGLHLDFDLVARSPWPVEIELEIVPGGAGFREVAMFHRASGTLLMTDLVQNFEPGKLPWVLRPLARLLGNAAPISRAPAHLRAVMRFGGQAAREAARRIVAWAPARIVVTHGRVIEENAAGRLLKSFEWLT